MSKLMQGAHWSSIVGEWSGGSLGRQDGDASQKNTAVAMWLSLAAGWGTHMGHIWGPHGPIWIHMDPYGAHPLGICMIAVSSSEAALVCEPRSLAWGND